VDVTTPVPLEVVMTLEEVMVAELEVVGTELDADEVWVYV
jgi:hypothetical protein